MKGPLTASIRSRLTGPIRKSKSRDSTSTTWSWRATNTLFPKRIGLSQIAAIHAPNRAAAAGRACSETSCAKNPADPAGVTMSGDETPGADWAGISFPYQYTTHYACDRKQQLQVCLAYARYIFEIQIGIYQYSFVLPLSS